MSQDDDEMAIRTLIRIADALDRIANAIDVVSEWEAEVWDEDDRVPDFLKNPRET
jgi:hypothetical protein